MKELHEGVVFDLGEGDDVLLSGQISSLSYLDTYLPSAGKK